VLFTKARTKGCGVVRKSDLEGFSPRQWASSVLCGAGQVEVQLFPACLPQVYMYQLFRSLAYIHSQGVCHRDIKPQNLLVDPDTAVLKLCDFGRWGFTWGTWVRGGGEGPHTLVCTYPVHLFSQCKAVGPWRAQCLLHMFSLLPCPRAHLWSHGLHLLDRSVREGTWGISLGRF
jgi:hypothetical protein